MQMKRLESKTSPNLNSCTMIIYQLSLLLNLWGNSSNNVYQVIQQKHQNMGKISVFMLIEEDWSSSLLKRGKSIFFHDFYSAKLIAWVLFIHKSRSCLPFQLSRKVACCLFLIQVCASLNNLKIQFHLSKTKIWS